MQIFHRSTNTISRATIFGAVFLVAGAALGAVLELQPLSLRDLRRRWPGRSPSLQPSAPCAGLGIDCRYCHTSVENSHFAGIPPTKTCMNCHSQIWTNAPLLEPVRESFRTGKSLVWNRVNDLPDFVYFNHSIHINKGVGCNTCHGPVDRMPLMYNYASLQDGVVSGLPSRAGEISAASRSGVQYALRAALEQSSRSMWMAKNIPISVRWAKYLIKKHNLRTVADITSCSTCHR